MALILWAFPAEDFRTRDACTLVGDRTGRSRFSERQCDRLKSLYSLANAALQYDHSKWLQFVMSVGLSEVNNLMVISRHSNARFVL